jgi:DNA segregation ATPase FtsK/SpoIIIE, S-DNA-T family
VNLKIDTSQILSLRYRTSGEADRYTVMLHQRLNLESKAQVARLAIGRSLGMGKLTEEPADAKGMDIPASSLFNSENIGAWVGLLGSHGLFNGGPYVQTVDEFRAAIRAHWHRGMLALWEDWTGCGEDYDKFLEALMRKSDMPTFGSHDTDGPSPTIKGPPAADPIDDSSKLVKALDELGIKVQVKDFLHGPRVTRYRVLLMDLRDLDKIKRSKSQLGLALNLGDQPPHISLGDEAKTVFIDLPRPRVSWNYAGVERLREWAPRAPKDQLLLMYAGVSVTGEDVVIDLARAPHLLVGGTTGSGKSVCLHSLILSLLLRNKGTTLQFALIDPKQVEFSAYSKLSNLYRGVIAKDSVEAREMLTELVAEMEARYAMFGRNGVANIGEYRNKGQDAPSIVVFIEELADLVMQDQQIEPLLERLAQKSRAAGIHLILATQRPDAKTFSGLIRGNVPSRIALTVQKGTESKIILDDVGAEDLLGSGDMLIKMSGEKVIRAHGTNIKLEDVFDILSSIRT